MPIVTHNTSMLLANELATKPTPAISPPAATVAWHPKRLVSALATGPMMSGTETNSDPTSAVLPLLSPKKSSSSAYSTPNENEQPSAIRCVTNEPSTTTQPQPPSGGLGNDDEPPPLEPSLPLERRQGGDFSSAQSSAALLSRYILSGFAAAADRRQRPCSVSRTPPAI